MDLPAIEAEVVAPGQACAFSISFACKKNKIKINLNVLVIWCKLKISLLVN